MPMALFKLVDIARALQRPRNIENTGLSLINAFLKSFHIYFTSCMALNAASMILVMASDVLVAPESVSISLTEALCR